MPELSEGAWIGADEQRREWCVAIHGDGDSDDGVTIGRTSPHRLHAEVDRERILDDIQDGYERMREKGRTEVAWRYVGPWQTGDDQVPAGSATNHDRLPAHIFDAALMAAFPGLPATMTLDEAGRRVAAALNAAWPLIEQEVRAKVADEDEGYTALAAAQDGEDAGFREAVLGRRRGGAGS